MERKEKIEESSIDQIVIFVSQGTYGVTKLTSLLKRPKIKKSFKEEYI